MHKISVIPVIAVASVLLLSACTPAQQPNPAKQDTSVMENKNSKNPSTDTSFMDKPTDVAAQTITGVMMVGGKMALMMKDGSTKPMEKDTTLANGTTVTMAGKVLDKTGKTTKTLKESEWVLAGDPQK